MRLISNSRIRWVKEERATFEYTECTEWTEWTECTEWDPFWKRRKTFPSPPDTTTHPLIEHFHHVLYYLLVGEMMSPVTSIRLHREMF